MGKYSKPAPNGFVAVARKVYHPLHFTKGYNFVFFFICAGALMGFSLARFMYLNINTYFCNPQHLGGAAPGECYYYSGEGGMRYRIGILLHLAGILPAALLACFQFVPVIRHKLLLVHRIDGYLVIILSFVATAGVFMIADKAFGGDLSLQTVTGLASIMFLTSIILSYINIKRLQIEQHRAWMLRAWAYAGCIITVRIIMAISTSIITITGDQYLVRSCETIDYMLFHFQNYTEMLYPDCASWYTGEDPNKHIAVKATLDGGFAENAAALGMSFGNAFWLALAIHAILVEVYLRLTPAEAERLRNVSYQRQLDARMKNPGNAGLTAQKLGDADEWVPETQRERYCEVPREATEYNGGENGSMMQYNNYNSHSQVGP